MVVAHDRLQNLPKMEFRLYEGSIVKADVFDEAGKKIQNTMAPTTPVAKGDFVTLYTSSTTTTPIAQVAAAGDDQVLGICVDNPVAGDLITGTGVPTVAKMRKATVAVFTSAIMNVTSDGGGAIQAGDVLGHSNGTVKQFEAGTPLTVAAHGNVVALEYCPAAASPFAVAFGAYMNMPNTA